MQKLAFYSTQVTQLNKREMKRLSDNCSSRAKVGFQRTDAAAQQFIYQWPDGLQVVINRMPGRMVRPHMAQMFKHLSETLEAPDAVALAKYLFHTTAVMAMVVKPDIDSEGRVEQLIENLVLQTKPLIYRDDQLDWSFVS